MILRSQICWPKKKKKFNSSKRKPIILQLFGVIGLVMVRILRDVVVGIHTMKKQNFFATLPLFIPTGGPKKREKGPKNLTE